MLMANMCGPRPSRDQMLYLSSLALHAVIAQSPFPPDMRTDCLTLITTAALGLDKRVGHTTSYNEFVDTA